MHPFIEKCKKIITISKDNDKLVLDTFKGVNGKNINEKIILLNYYADLVANNKDNKIYLLTLVMLFNGAKMEEINDNLIQKTLTKFRRKK